jgi:hypothetical protein
MSSGMDEDCARFLIHALHPPVLNRPVARAPTGGDRPSAIFQAEQAVDVSISSSGPAQDVLIISTNGDSTSALVAKRNSGDPWVGFNTTTGSPYTTPSTDSFAIITQPIVAGDGYLALCPLLQRVAPTAGSPFNTDQTGVVYGPGWNVSGLPVAWRRLATSITVYNTSATLVDGGTVVAGTFDLSVSPDDSALTVYPILASTPSRDTIAYQVTTDNTPFLVAGVGPAATQNIWHIPFEETDMVRMNPGCYVGPARQGVYVPTRLAEHFNWVEPQPARDLLLTGVISGVSASIFDTPNVQSPQSAHLEIMHGANAYDYGQRTFCRAADQIFTSRRGVSIPYVPGSSNNTSFDTDATANVFSVHCSEMQSQYRNGLVPTAPVFSTGLDDSQTSIILFSSLTPGASLHIKTICVYEVVPELSSDYAFFTQLPPKHNPLALQLYWQIARELPQATVASENGLGTFLTAIWGVLKVVGPPILRSLGLMAVDAASRKVVEVVESATSRAKKAIGPPHFVVKGGQKLEGIEYVAPGAIAASASMGRTNPSIVRANPGVMGGRTARSYRTVQPMRSQPSRRR